MLDLTNFEVKEKQTLTVEAEFPEDGSGFHITIQHLGQEESRAISRNIAADLVFKGGKLTPKRAGADIEAYADLIVSWRGLTPEILGQLIAEVDIESIRSFLEQHEMSEISCTKANKMFLLRKARGFLTFVESVCSDVALYRQQQKDREIKN